MSSHQIQFRVDLGRWRQISDAAKAEGMNISDYARWCLVQHAKHAALESRIIASEATIIRALKNDFERVADDLACRLSSQP